MPITSCYPGFDVYLLSDQPTKILFTSSDRVESHSSCYYCCFLFIFTMLQEKEPHWLDRYASSYHAWTLSTTAQGRPCFTRLQGLVECSFDLDGLYYGGRADMTATLKCVIAHQLSPADWRRRIALAWAALRLRHVLLLSRAFDKPESGERCFAVEVPCTLDEAVADVEKRIVWVEDHYQAVDPDDFHNHALSVARIIEPESCLSKLHVSPLRSLSDGTYELSFLIVMAHQICDGLTTYGWFKDFLRLLNQPVDVIEDEITASLQVDVLRTRLPSAQEDLYPPIIGNRARQRWIWAILRVLRHIKRAPPPTFANPLYRSKRLEKPETMQQRYAKVFSYEGANMPPMSSGFIIAALSKAASAKLISLCREAKLSIGAGCFALVGLAMMDLHAAQNPGASSFPAMTASFPLDPRGFFADRPPADSCMLAFSNGIAIPFLPRSLPVEQRFKLATRTANRELKTYQKRLKTTKGESVGLDKHSPSRLLATGYISQIERIKATLPLHKRSSITDLQGELKPGGDFSATCGVSSVGSLKGFFRPGEYNLSDKGRDLVVDYRELRLCVRAREGEFLVLSSTDGEERVEFSVSYDMNAIDSETAEMWVKTITELLEKKDRPKL
ncbi:hypothetical protein C7974DRAFT_387871 [Boeremia exigua]|uniref:uncharacterized protein n=1 Tax=Boeremia exigua TaxID=749465 RepID=UPI001E8CEB7A|nr:uncharacterized protein C7974DRAFT_387871 [Boeremia exigua]KAH6639096.1 hypothetical protein C7974DRAFT_387871 [Boeremia exigua]